MDQFYNHVGLDELNSSNSRDLSELGLTDLPSEDEISKETRESIFSLLLQQNNISILPPQIKDFMRIRVLDISDNGMRHISEELSSLIFLRSFVAKNNNLDDDSLPKCFDQLQSLEYVNLGGNNFTLFPPQLIHMPNIKRLYLASNRISELPDIVEHMKSLEVLNLADNLLSTIPSECGNLSNLTSLNLANNRLRTLPRSLITLHKLKSLSLHNNKLATLPPEIVALNVVELSLRNNPLVVKFVETMTFSVPSLLELAGRTVKLSQLLIPTDYLPRELEAYLNSANKCVNPRCKGVFFSSRVEHVKFVDFCGKYRLPLLHYLCSPTCSDEQPNCEGSSESESDEEMAAAKARMKRVLLG